MSALDLYQEELERVIEEINDEEVIEKYRKKYNGDTYLLLIKLLDYKTEKKNKKDTE